MAAGNLNNKPETPREITRQGESDSLLQGYFAALGKQEEARQAYMAAGVGNYDKLPPRNSPPAVLQAHAEMKAAEEFAEDWKNKWQGKFPLQSFKKAAEAYAAATLNTAADSGLLGAASVDAFTQERLGALAAKKETVILNTQEAKTQLRSDIEGILQKEGVANILSALHAVGLTIEDLIVSTAKDADVTSRQRRAIAIVAPNHANIILNSLVSGDPAAMAEANAILINIHDKLKAAHQITEETNKELSNFSEEKPTEFVKDKLGKLMDSVKEKPVETAVAGLVLAGVLYYLWNNHTSDGVKKFLGLAGAGLLVGYSANFLSGALSEDGKTLVQRVWGDPISWQPDSPAMQSLNDAIEKRYADSNAFEAMMQMKGATVGTITAELERSLYQENPEERFVRKSAFTSANEISFLDAGFVDQHALYKGYATIAMDLARKEGVDASVGEEALLRRGIQLMKQKYSANTTLPYLVGDVYVGLNPGNEVNNADGSLLGANVGSRSPEQLAEERSLETLFTANGKTPEVLYIQNSLDAKAGTATYLVNGYPFKITKIVAADRKVTYKIEDPKKTLAAPMLPTGAIQATDAAQIQEYAEKAAKKDFDDNFNQGSAYTLEYIKEPGKNIKGFFRILGLPAAPELKALQASTDKDPALELRVRYNAQGTMELTEKGGTAPQESIEKATETRKETLAKAAIKRELSFLLGGLTYTVDTKFVVSGTATGVPITYEGTKRGSFTFEQGKVTSVVLEQSPELEKVWLAKVKEGVDELMKFRDIEQVFEALALKISKDQSVLNNDSWTSWIKGYGNAIDFFGAFDTSQEFADRSVGKVKERLKLQYADKWLSTLRAGATGALSALPKTERDWDQQIDAFRTDIFKHVKGLGIAVPAENTWAVYAGVRAEQVRVLDPNDKSLEYDAKSFAGKDVLEVETEASRARIVASFTRLRKGSWENYLLGTGFEKFKQDRINFYQDQITGLITGLKSGSTFTLKGLKDGLASIEKSAEAEVVKFDTLDRSDRGYFNIFGDNEADKKTFLLLTEQHLTGAQAPQWKKAHEFFFDYMGLKFNLGNEYGLGDVNPLWHLGIPGYGMKLSINIQDQNVIRGIHDYFIQQIGAGATYHAPSAAAPGKTPEAYTIYLVEEIGKLVSTQYSGKTTLDMAMWEQTKLALAHGSGDPVLTYDEWFNDATKNPIKPMELDKDRIAAENLERIKETAKTYVEQELSGMVSETLFGCSGWRAAFRTMGVERYKQYVLENTAIKTKNDLQIETDKFLKLMDVEGRLYEFAYQATVKPGSKDGYIAVLGILSVLGAGGGGALAYRLGGTVFRGLLGAIAGGTLAAGLENLASAVTDKLPSFGVATGTDLLTKLRAITDDDFDTAYTSGTKDPAVFAAAIGKNWKDAIDAAAVHDDRNINVGPVAFNWGAIDPLQSYIIPFMD